MALVIGNSSYRRLAALRNPGNDANAVSEALKASGFDVTLLADCSRVRMVESLRAYTEQLRARQGIGLFYFAGHGLQLDWRNYLLPVDASVESARDVPRHGVDVAELMAGLTQAANPLNVVILDACRDNPFAQDRRVDQKGLSQMDAPPNTLLAYATSPGHTASDGEGANGLYTEHLVREMGAADAKIEDVFKRVRLGVRRKSAGQQIPWESTSLEEDFYFRPPVATPSPSEAEQERRLDEEFAAFMALRGGKDPAAVEAFLRHYPSGRYSELALLSLDRLLAAQGERKIAVPSAEGNPFTQGTRAANIRFQVRDRYGYRVTDLEDPVKVRTFTHRVTAISETEVVFNDGKLVTDLLGNTVYADERRFSPRQDQATEYTVGKRWFSRFRVLDENDKDRRWTDQEFRVAARERITVPAGTFDCYRIEGRGSGQRGRRTLDSRVTYWMAPYVVRRYVRLDVTRHMVNPRGVLKTASAERFELVEFKQV